MLVPEQARTQHRKHRRDYEQSRTTRPMNRLSSADLHGLHESGREFPIDISLSPIESDEGPLVIAAIRDMTERRSIERELRRVNEQLRRDVNVAARIQRSLLPDRSAGIPGFAVEWLFEPCDRLGGDSFNVFEAVDKFVGFYMLDVTGHGIVTALQSVALTRILASTWPQPNDPMPAKLAERLNAEFPINVEAWQYFTFLGGVLDRSAGVLRYVSAGHHGPIHVPAGGAPVALEAAGLPIGMFPDAEYDEFTKPLGRGDRIYLFSDGVTEAMNEAEEDFGIERLVAALRGRGRAAAGRNAAACAPFHRLLVRGRRAAGRLHAPGAGGLRSVSARSSGLNRREFLSLTGAALGAAPFHALACRHAGVLRPDTTVSADGYGPLAPVRDETTGLPLLQLPGGFRYRSFGWAGDALAGGLATPGLHDGMAAFAADGSRIRLVRNHEIRTGGAFAERPIYDANGGGGTTTIEFDTATGAAGRAWASLAGTAVNCAGGMTPWGSWLTCEETLLGPGAAAAYERPHGYIFEVPADGTASAEPLRAMGRFVHEAIAVDPDTGIIYETEDQMTAGLYRFLPATAGNLAAGGRLEMLGVAGAPRAALHAGQKAGEWLPVSWMPIDDPDPPDIAPNGVYMQGRRRGGAEFRRLEGIWYGDGRIYIVSTIGGDAGVGQVWEYDPSGERLRLFFESPDISVLELPDNLCVSPHGGLMLCEDGRGRNFVRWLSPDGRVFPFAGNNVVLYGERNGMVGDFRASEFAGAAYSPDGRWFFVNVQVPGISFAITGPWARPKGSIV